MGLEAATYPSQLVATNPTAGDPKSQGDDHIRMLKTVLQSTLPNITGAITATQAQLNTVGITQPLTDNSTNVASTAYAQTAASAAAALVNRDIPMSLVAVTGTTATAVGGQHHGNASRFTHCKRPTVDYPGKQLGYQRCSAQRQPDHGSCRGHDDGQRLHDCAPEIH